MTKRTLAVIAAVLVILGGTSVGIAETGGPSTPVVGEMFGGSGGTVRVGLLASVSGGTLTLTAKANPHGGGTPPVPTGTITFSYGSTTLCTTAALVNDGNGNGTGSGTHADPGLANDYTIIGSYSGDINYAANSGTMPTGVAMTTTASVGGLGFTVAGTSTTYSVTATTDSGLALWTGDTVAFFDQANPGLCTTSAFASSGGPTQTLSCTATAPVWPQGVLPSYMPISGSPLSQDAPGQGGTVLASLLAYPSSCYGDPASASITLADSDVLPAINSLTTGGIWNGENNCFVTGGVTVTANGTCVLGDEPTPEGANDLTIENATLYDTQNVNQGTLRGTIEDKGNCWAVSNMTLDGSDVYGVNTNQSQLLPSNSGVEMQSGPHDTLLQNIVSNDPFGDGLTAGLPGTVRYLWVNSYLSYNAGRDGFVPASLDDAIITNMTIISPDTNAIDAESDEANNGATGLVFNNLVFQKFINFIEALGIGSGVFGGDGETAPNAVTFNGLYGIVGPANGGTWTPSPMAAQSAGSWLLFEQGHCTNAAGARADGTCAVYIGPSTTPVSSSVYTAPADDSGYAGTYDFPAITSGERSAYYMPNQANPGLQAKGGPLTVEDTDIERVLPIPGGGSSNKVWTVNNGCTLRLVNTTYIPQTQNGPTGTNDNQSTVDIVP